MMDASYTNCPGEILADEARLIRQAQSGDAYAFAQLHDAYVEHVYRYITFRVENDRIAEAITIRVFFKAWEQLDRYRSVDSSMKEWLYSIAQHEIAAYYRTHKRTTTQTNDFALALGSQYSDEDAQEKFDMQAMRDGLQFLTEEEQQILILKFVAGLPTNSIARMISKREDHVRALQFRALQRLSKYLKEKEVL